MKTKIVRIGNSHGVRIPKPLLEEAGLEGDVELRVIDEGIVIRRIRVLREGWGDAARALRDAGEDGLLDEHPRSRFDESDWTWE